MTITILGPTASGKTSLASHLAHKIDGEILSADSRQIYKGMDIGTGKDLSDYIVGNKPIPYHLIDIRTAGDKYTLFDYQNDFHKALGDVCIRNKKPIICGGTGLYIESILKGYNLPDVPENVALRKELEPKSMTQLEHILSSLEQMHNTTDLDTKKRVIRAIEIAHYRKNNIVSSNEIKYPSVDSTIFGIDISRDMRRLKISKRLNDRLNEGMIQEVQKLIDGGVSPDDLIYYGLEYKYVTMYVVGQLSFNDMFIQLETAIHQFSKRQMTWFRGMERRGFVINWIDYSLSMDDKINAILSTISKK